MEAPVPPLPVFDAERLEVPSLPFENAFEDLDIAFSDLGIANNTPSEEGDPELIQPVCYLQRLCIAFLTRFRRTLSCSLQAVIAAQA